MGADCSSCHFAYGFPIRFQVFQRPLRRPSSRRALSLDISEIDGLCSRCLPFLHLHWSGCSTPFGFVDPDDIMRNAYLIPAFDHGSTTDLLGASKLARRLRDDDGDDDDCCYYYVCSYVCFFSLNGKKAKKKKGHFFYIF